MNNDILEFNFVHHSPAKEQIEKYDTIRKKFKEVSALVNEVCTDGREKNQSMVNIEQAMFWANASIARDKKFQ